MNEQEKTTGKHIVLLSDGTGNRGGKGHGTNVWRTYQALDRGASGAKQIAFYDDGVGSQDNKVLRAIGGAFGWGLTRNVLELYTSLALSYRPGDRISLFGFSRGAYTVRLLAGMICECGVIDAQRVSDPRALTQLVKQTHELYKRKNADQLRQHREALGERGEANVHFMGVWDTVDAVGLPFDLAARKLLNALINYRFDNQTLHPRVDKACHALAIDDARGTFHPVMWDHCERRDGAGQPRIEQLWFAGMHANVGGGYPKDSLSLPALNWMLGKAEQAGLRFDPELRARYLREADDDGKLYDSRAGFAAYYRYGVRDAGEISGKVKLPDINIHSSAVRRLSHASNQYNPVNLPGGLQVQGSSRRTSLGVMESLPGDEPDTLALLQQHLDAHREQISAASKAAAPIFRSRKLAYYCQLAASAGVLLLGGAPLLGALIGGDSFAVLAWLIGLDWRLSLGILAVAAGIYAWQKSLKQRERSAGMALWQRLRPFPRLGKASVDKDAA